MAWYVVFRGRRLGVYSDWAICQAQVSGFRHSSYQKYGTIEEVVHAYQRFLLAQHGVQRESNDERYSSHKVEGLKHTNADKGEHNKNNNTRSDVLLVVNILALVVVAISVWLK